ncbi:hypothetical protein [Actinoplanes sp. NPDC049316]|uniref:hypothetical protein n=1 Tax=Actinoplanes sp. NPDC049316 TaxID=3154727 RepID=UPI00344A359B
MTPTPMSGKRHAFYIDETMQTEHGYIPSIVNEDEPGHTPLRGNGPYASPWYWGHDITTARAIAAKANADLGLTETDVRDIIASSFRAGETIAEAGHIIRSLVAGAVSYDVASGDEPDAGCTLRRVTSGDGTVLDHNDPTFAIIAGAVEPYLSRVTWGRGADRGEDGVRRIDVRTGRWLREP